MNHNTEATEVYAAKLSLIGTALSTLGDGLQTLAAGIVLQELKNTNNQNQVDQSIQLEIMQQQIDYLTQKIQEIERQGR